MPLTYNGKLDKLAQQNKNRYARQKATKDSFKWFKDNIGTAFKRGVSAKNTSWISNRLDDHIPKNTDPGISIVPKPVIGHLYFYVYNPKWKDELPYYDMFPLTMPIEPYDDGFLGLNFHYLPVELRAKLLDSILKWKAEKSQAEYIKISYKALKSLQNTIYAPTIKRYLWSHFRSNFAEINFNVWDRILFLPVEDFKKATVNRVWEDSRRSIKKK